MISHMAHLLVDRVEALERAALRAEGAHFALHDLVARTLARIPETDYRTIIAELSDHAQHLDHNLGPDRIEGYRDELTSIADEVSHARSDARGLLARLARTISGGEG